MRKIGLSVLIFAAVTAAASAATITVTSPRAGDVLCQGRAYQVRWTSSGVTGRVMVRLMQAGVVHSYLSWDTENDGLFDYTVPNTVREGEYIVAVLSRDDRSASGQSGSFRISSCLVTAAPPPPMEIMPQITITSPSRPTQADFIGFYGYVGGYMKIQWTTRGRMPSIVNITLHPVDCSGDGIYLSTANPSAGEQLVRIPTMVTSEGLQSIRVGAFPGAPFGCSRFNLYNALIVTEPRLGSVWHPGESVAVRWRGPGGFNTHLILASEGSIRRFRFFDSSDRILAESIPASDGTRRITLPADLAPGRYAVYLACVVGSAAHLCAVRDGTFSEIFQVVAR